MPRGSNTPATVELQPNDEFVLTLKYGGFTQAKYGFSVDGSIAIEGGDHTSNARLYITKEVRNQIAAKWPGREGEIEATCHSKTNWEIHSITESQYAHYDPSVKAWNNNTNSFEEVPWDEDGEGGGEKKAAPKTEAKADTKVKKSDLELHDLVDLFKQCWECSGIIMEEHFVAGKLPSEAMGARIDSQYKAAFTLYNDARRMGIQATVDRPLPEEDEEDEGDLPF